MTSDSLPSGVATSMGSLPHRRSSEAVSFVLELEPELPAAPSIPAAAPMEGMISQAAWGVPGITVGPDGSLAVDQAALDPEAPLTDPGLTGPPFATFRHFLRAVGDRHGPVKLQLTGPVTLGMALRASGVDEQLAFRGPPPRCSSGPITSSRWPTTTSAATLVTFLDEPSLVGGQRSELPLDADHTIDLVSGAARHHRASAPLPGCTAAARRTGGSCCKRARRCSRCRSMPASTGRQERSAASSTAVDGSPGARCPPTARSAITRRGRGASSRVSGASWCRPAVTRSRCVARRW